MAPAACIVKRKRKAKQGEGRKVTNPRHGGGGGGCIHPTRTPRMGYGTSCLLRKKEKKSKARRRKKRHKPQAWGCVEFRITYIHPEHPEWVMAPAACLVKGNKGKEKERNAQTALCAPEQEHLHSKVQQTVTNSLWHFYQGRPSFHLYPFPLACVIYGCMVNQIFFLITNSFTGVASNRTCQTTPTYFRAYQTSSQISFPSFE